MTPIKNVLQIRATLGEGTLWDADRQFLYWLDIESHRVHQFNPETGNNRFFDVGDVVGAIALAQVDRLILAQRDRLAFLDTQTGEVTPIVFLETDKPKNRFNDGKCDSQGRFWFGSMSEDEGQGSLFRYDPDGTLQVMETGLTISNGLGWSPDETTFYLTDTPRQKIYAYDFDAQTGQIRNRRVFIDLSNESFFPDGLTIDAQGYLWSAMWDGWRVMRFNTEGQAVMQIPLPVKCPTCCTFGGKGLTDLYITTASTGLSPEEIEQNPQSGDLFCLQTDIIGLPAHRFRGKIG